MILPGSVDKDEYEKHFLSVEFFLVPSSSVDASGETLKNMVSQTMQWVMDKCPGLDDAVIQRAFISNVKRVYRYEWVERMKAVSGNQVVVRTINPIVVEFKTKEVARLVEWWSTGANSSTIPETPGIKFASTSLNTPDPCGTGTAVV